MIPRKDYLEDKVDHRAYFAQFVNENVKHAILDAIGLDRLRASRDPHLNDIPLREWDDLAGGMCPTSSGLVNARLLRETGEGLSLAGLVCIYKEAAKQLIESESK
jgi:hypothetical protein